MNKNNCLSYALNLEESKLDIPVLEGWKKPQIAIANLLKEIGVSTTVRTLNNPDEELEEGEWLVAFFGFIPSHRDYEGRVDGWDYHFVKREGSEWKHRKGCGEEIELADMELLVKEYTEAGYLPQYFGVRS